MSIQSEINRLNAAKTGIASAIEDGGVSIPSGAKLDSFPELVRQLKTTTIPATGVTDLVGTDYTTNRVRGIQLQASEPTSVPNGCLVGVYE